MHQHGGDRGINDLNIDKDGMKNIIQAAVYKGFTKIEFSDSACFSPLKIHIENATSEAFSENKTLAQVSVLSSDDKETTIASKLFGKISINKQGTSKKRDRDVYLRAADDTNQVIKLTIRGTQIHTGNLTDIYTEDWQKRELNHSASIAALVEVVQNTDVTEKGFQDWFEQQKHIRDGNTSPKYSIASIASIEGREITLSQYKQAAKHLINHYHDRRQRKPFDKDAAQQPPFNYKQEDLDKIKENDAKINKYCKWAIQNFV